MLTAKFLSMRQFLWVSVLQHSCCGFQLQKSGENHSGFAILFKLYRQKKKSPPLCAAVSHSCDPSDAAIGWKTKMKSVLLAADRQPPWTLSLITGGPLLIGVLWPFQLSFTQHPGVQQTANTGLLHPYNMVTASPNNNQLDAGFMNKWSIPRRPYFPRFSLFSWAHCWPWKEVI